MNALLLLLEHFNTFPEKINHQDLYKKVFCAFIQIIQDKIFQNYLCEESLRVLTLQKYELNFFELKSSFLTATFLIKLT